MNHIGGVMINVLAYRRRWCFEPRSSQSKDYAISIFAYPLST